jgi:hypothetical protein
MENQSTSSPRPTFLTILCILSFVGLGWAIINNLFTLAFSSTGSWFYSLLQEELEKALNEASMSDPGAVVFLENLFDGVLDLVSHLPVLGTAGLIFSVIGLIGVILMWGLKKTGFYLYTGAKIAMIFAPMVIAGFSFITMMIAISTAFWAIIFIILYALNFKHLK